MALPYNQLRGQAESKLDDAEFLFQAERHSTAYYLFGIAIELSLKTCISIQFSKDTIPDKKMVDSIYSHDIDSLFKLSGLKLEFEKELEKNKYLSVSWSTVKKWKVDSRYQMIDPVNSTSMRNAVVDKVSGVFPWIQNRWPKVK